MESQNTPNLSGGGALDLSDPRDRAAIRNAIKEWPKRFRAITPEKRDNWVNDLEDARATAKDIADGDGTPMEMKLQAVQVVRSCVQTSGMLDTMQQRDEHADAAAKLKDQHHLESLAQADRHHAEGSKTTVDSTVRMLVVDATGREQPIAGLRDYYNRFPAGGGPGALPAPTPAPEPPQQAQGGDGGTPGG